MQVRVLRSSLFAPPPPLSCFVLCAAETDAQLFPYLLVNIGSGVSIIRVDGPGEGQHVRVSGSSVGGGTFWGLCRLLTGRSDFDEILQLSMQGNNANVRGIIRGAARWLHHSVHDHQYLCFGHTQHRAFFPVFPPSSPLQAQVDMLVGDIYGGRDYSSIGLSASTIACSFGKVVGQDRELADYNPAGTQGPDTHDNQIGSIQMPCLPFFLSATPCLCRPLFSSTPLPHIDDEAYSASLTVSLPPAFLACALALCTDMAMSLCRMVAYNIGQLAYMHAKRYGLTRVFFGGFFIRGHPYTMETISFAIKFWSQARRTSALAHACAAEAYLPARVCWLFCLVSGKGRVNTVLPSHYTASQPLRPQPPFAVAHINHHSVIT